MLLKLLFVETDVYSDYFSTLVHCGIRCGKIFNSFSTTFKMWKSVENSQKCR